MQGLGTGFFFDGFLGAGLGPLDGRVVEGLGTGFFFDGFLGAGFGPLDGRVVQSLYVVGVVVVLGALHCRRRRPRPNPRWRGRRPPAAAMTALAVATACCSAQSPGSDTLMPPSRDSPGTSPLRCWTTWVSSWAIVSWPWGDEGLYLPSLNTISLPTVKAWDCTDVAALEASEPVWTLTSLKEWPRLDSILERTPSSRLEPPPLPTTFLTGRILFLTLHERAHGRVAGLALQVHRAAGTDGVGTAVLNSLGERPVVEGAPILGLGLSRLGADVEILEQFVLGHVAHLRLGIPPECTPAAVAQGGRPGCPIGKWAAGSDGGGGHHD